jgi:pyruvate/2-oxoglutarate dehydrogenase complex dihydrolipoamide acyltransferase (E2) component
MAGDRNQSGHRVEPFSLARRQQIDWLELGHRRHTMHALLEVDVTEARRSIREYRSKTGASLSFTAFVVWCLARAIDGDRRMHAYRQGRGRLVLFEEVDVTVLVERRAEGERVPVPYVLRAANTKGLAEIDAEIRTVQGKPATPAVTGARWLRLWLLLPGFLRRFFWAALLANPHRRKRLGGTAVVTSLGMFGRGPAWGIPVTFYTLCLTVGGIARKPGVVRAGRGEERIEVREYLSLTLSLDHDVIDGAPAARFVTRLKELIEAGVCRIESG